jgi:hypothetical protein
MVDKEKVLVGLKSCADSTGALCRTCPYDFVHNENCMGDMARDALELLKEQEAVEPILKRKGKSKMYNDYVCPVCDNEVVYGQCYCSECGKPFLWERR